MAPKLNPSITRWIRSGAARPYPLSSNMTEAQIIYVAARHDAYAERHGGFQLGYRTATQGAGWELIPRIIR